MNKLIQLSLLLIFFNSCQEEIASSDAFGNFETTTTTISAESNGKLLFLNVEEGRKIEAGQLVAIIDTTSLHLQRRQIDATINTLPQKVRNAIADIDVLQNQKANLLRERDRVDRLLKKKAATPKQLDDLNGEIDVVEKRIAAIRSSTEITNRSILSEKGPLLAQRDIISNLIRKSYIYNPVSGMVLTKLKEPNEIVGGGSPLYRVSDLDTMTLRFYASAVQLQQVALGDAIDVLIDEGQDSLATIQGKVFWIAEEAEFTPKTIQTKEERVSLVYALKAAVPNPSGRLKIGMPAEVNFK